MNDIARPGNRSLALLIENFLPLSIGTLRYLLPKWSLFRETKDNVFLKNNEIIP